MDKLLASYHLELVSDEKEIFLMKKAAEISSTAILALIAEIKPYASEKDIALRLEIIARQSGADQVPQVHEQQ